MKKFLYSISFFFLASHPVFAGTGAAPASRPAATIFQQANQAYRGGDYPQAASLYEHLITGGKREGNFFYNLGNTYFKQGRLGPAILQFERARKKNPRDRDVLANLNYVKGLLEYRVEDKRNWYLRAFETLLAFVTQKEAGIVSFALSLFFLLSWVVPLYFRPDMNWGWRRKTVLVLAALAFSFWLTKGFHDLSVQEAIVLKPQATVRYGPSYKDQAALRLGEGIKVRVTKKEGEWSRIALTNGDTGWIAQEDLEVI